MKDFYWSKLSLIATNLIYLFISILLITVAGYARLVAYITSIGVVGGLIACGLFLFVLAVIGLIGTYRHNRKILLFYVIILFGLFVIQFSVACACLALNSENERKLIEKTWETSANATKVDMMRHLSCCGFERNDVYGALGHPPCSLAGLPCCKGSSAPCCVGKEQSHGDPTCPCKRSCWSVVSKNLEWGTRLAGVLGLLFSIFEIIGVWLALRYRHQYDPLVNPNLYM